MCGRALPAGDTEEAGEMVRVYQSGVRQVDIAAQFGRNPGNVWHVLKWAGAFDLY